MHVVRPTVKNRWHRNRVKTVAVEGQTRDKMKPLGERLVPASKTFHTGCAARLQCVCEVPRLPGGRLKTFRSDSTWHSNRLSLPAERVGSGVTNLNSFPFQRARPCGRLLKRLGGLRSGTALVLLKALVASLKHTGLKQNVQRSTPSPSATRKGAEERR